ncbi:hypothetical protein P170DRAFT_263157 [Aspergillus steynii IBT 23096]|uniref:MARVEL domain-containing protein n=1 Tax=Aspergillus steynii IBT 23096 TaxID=1392250 RepID=A0A2I2G091_9EURO|nr:uncharacterized protein P170DRAFT_263157 [Aspergillus steynii IBT 23096]PLB46246.1 hypothetical protein P170DRAFT_263157 [Aspergillus steynii IBT 23096]
MIDLSIHNNPTLKFRLHIVIGALLFLNFILIIARLANPGTPASRANTWGIAVCVKSAVFMAYQIVSTHVNRFKRWASPKANMILNIIDTIFWFALFIITCMSTAGSCSGSSCPLGGLVATLAIILCGFSGLLSFVCIRDHRYFKANGTLPGMAKPASHGGV